MTDALDDVLQVLATDGWKGLEVDPKMLDRQMQAQMQEMTREALASGVLVFESEQGRRCLAWLVAKTLLRPPSLEQQAAKTAQEYAAMALRREGQNQLVWMIFSALRAARGEKAKVEG